MDQTKGSRDSQNLEDTVIEVSAPHTSFGGRVTAIAASPNLVYIGTASGEIRVNGRVNGEYQSKRWDQENRCIEGVMYDYEGKMVYATEMNLVMVDKTFTRKLKEYSSYDPLRKIRSQSAHPHHRPQDEAQSGPHQGRLVGQQRRAVSRRSGEA
jgi:hypothetical protein